MKDFHCQIGTNYIGFTNTFYTKSSGKSCLNFESNFSMEKYSFLYFMHVRYMFKSALLRNKLLMKYQQEIMSFKDY